MNKKTISQLDNLGLIERIYCSDEEMAQLKKSKRKNLPNDVYYDNNYFWRYDTASLPEIDLKTRILLKSANDIMTIKYCAVFFVVLSVISIILYLIAFY